MLNIKMRGKESRIVLITGVIIAGLFTMFLGAWIFQAIWNNVLVQAMTIMNHITYIDALLIMIGIRLLFINPVSTNSKT